MKAILHGKLDTDVYEKLVSITEIKASKSSNKHKERHIKKYRNLTSEEKVNEDIPNKIQSVINMSSKTLDSATQSVLEKGFNFAIAPKNIPMETIITGVEAAISHLQEEDAEEVRNETIHILKRAKVPKSNLTREESKALSQLRKDKDICILPADKGNSTVVMDATTYDSKVYEIINDLSTYKPLKSDPTSKIEKQVTKKIKESSIPENLHKSIIPKNSRSPKFYGRPKVHKTNVPLRPVVDQISCPTYLLSKYLKTYLSAHAYSSKYNVKNTKDLINKLKDIQIDETDILLSLDVSSLFTNVPIKDSLDIIKGKLTNSNNNDNVLELIELCLTSSYFSFKDKFYEQVDGVAMGSPLSPIIAEIFMDWFEERALGTSRLEPKCYLRYVDDTFIIWQHGEKAIEEFLEHMNSIHSKIKFTLEKEKDGTLPFLDVLIIKDGKSLKHKVFRKATHNNKYLNGNSHHHPAQKRGLVNCLIDRAKTISSPEFLNEETKIIRHVLIANGHKSGLVENVIKKHSSKPANQDEQAPDNRKRAILPYIQGTTDKVAKVLAKQEIKTSFSVCSSLKELFPKVKDKTPILKNKGVYKIPCSCKKVYIGETGRNVNVRVNEHIRDDKKGRTNTSAIAEHTHETGHSMAFDDVKVLCKEEDYFKRKIRESIEIIKHRENINRDDGYKLSKSWLPLFKNM